MESVKTHRNGMLSPGGKIPGILLPLAALGDRAGLDDVNTV
jgi:hypothetical protein